mgnify:CR=1 FL=1
MHPEEVNHCFTHFYVGIFSPRVHGKGLRNQVLARELGRHLAGVGARVDPTPATHILLTVLKAGETVYEADKLPQIHYEQSKNI